jgi:hypothetical protein
VMMMAITPSLNASSRFLLIRNFRFIERAKHSHYGRPGDIIT